MYGNYGRQEDLEVVQKNDIELKGSVLLLRTGKLSFAEQVCVCRARGGLMRRVSLYQSFRDLTCFHVSDC